MKRNLMIMGACMTMGLSSCVWSESVEEVIAQTEIPQIVEQITESRSANGLVCMDGGDYVFTEIDWNKPVEDPLKDYVTDDQVEQAGEELIQEGCREIFGTSFGFGDGMKALAAKHPDIYFFTGQGWKPRKICPLISAGCIRHAT